MTKRKSLSIEDSDILLICEVVPLECENDSNADIISLSSDSGENLEAPVEIKLEKDGKEHSKETATVKLVSCDWNVEDYRNPFEPEQHWELRRKFMNQHKRKVPEQELVSLAQTFVNVELLGAVYCEEIMARLALLRGSIAEEYHNFKKDTVKRILVPASEAAVDWLYGISESHKTVERKRHAAELLGPVIPITSINDVFRNIVLLDDNLEESGKEFEKLGCGQFVYDSRIHEQKHWEASVTVAGFCLFRAIGSLKKVKCKCREEVLKLLRKKCYKIKTNLNRCWAISNVERLEVDEDLDMNGNPFDHLKLSFGPPPPKDKLKEDNIGYQMLKKLGWGGGPLGKHKEGIVDPIEVQAKRGRTGLGLPQRASKSIAGTNGSHTSVFNNFQTGLDLSQVPFRIDVFFYRDLMVNFKAKQLGYDLIFSEDFTAEERALLLKIAIELNLPCTTITYDYEHYQFVLMKHLIPPHELLVKILVEKHPTYCSMYTVEPPDEELAEHNKLLELCSR